MPGPPRARFTRPVGVVPLAQLRGPASGIVGPPPLTLFWSGGDPQTKTWDLDEPDSRDLFYRVVLAEGSTDDVRRWLHADLLVEGWPRLYLPPHVRSAWADQLGVVPA